MDYLQQHIEALIFCAQEPVTDEDIRNCLSEMFEAEIPVEDVQTAIRSLQEKYQADSFPFGVFQSGGGWQFQTKPAYQVSISILLKQKSKKRLSTAALETLSIIAYKQPISKTDIEHIRGVNCDYAVHKLLERELIEIKGKSEAVGKPLLYGTGKKFMDYFGINSLDELPLPKDFSSASNEIGEASEN